MNEKYIKNQITIYDVAKSAKVSLATVSRVINGQTSVKESTKLKVEKTIEMLGYKPSALAQSLASNKSANIAIIIPSSYKTYISLVLAGMLDVAKIYGYKTNVFTIKHDGSDYYEVMELVIKARVDGVIIYHPQLPAEVLDNLEKFKMPVIHIGTETRTGNKRGNVILDLNTKLNEYLVEYKEQYNRKILILNNKSKTDDINEIFIKEDDEDYIIPIQDSYTNAYNYFYQEFQAGNYKNSLLIAPRDTLAIAIVNAATDLKIKIPQDLEVLSLIDTGHNVRSRPMISSFKIDLYEVGSIGMRMLTKLLADKLAEKTYTFISSYIKRQTTNI